MTGTGFHMDLAEDVSFAPMNSRSELADTTGVEAEKPRLQSFGLLESSV